MINEKEIQATQLSATKKDYYQIWSELLDVANKISDRWSPASTNETDPGVVLLKVATALADKLNYTIDKNILEAFMPSAAQEESMRKLCEMMGYNVKYYQSATTKVNISFTGEFPDGMTEIKVPAFSSITNTDADIYYVTLDPVSITPDQKIATDIDAIQGQKVQCETDLNNIINLTLLDDNNRYYLPESQIAENGIYVYYASSGYNGEQWTQVDNLNTLSAGSTCYKFGYDSKLSMPYLQFPDDISSIINDGLYIYFIRTDGINGNVSANTLCSLEKPEVWSAADEDSGYSKIEMESFTVTQPSSSTNGKNIETINQAYNNYKKTIGTFDTLVTCRDYMNKIYSLIDKDTFNPIVSNVIVSDIRDDINRSVTICSFDGFGINYDCKSIQEDNTNLINHFDLIIYPFKTITNSKDIKEYKKSFTYSTENSNLITDALDETKTIAHNIIYPNSFDFNEIQVACIKNYLKLNARITTTYKVNSIEASTILQNIRTKLYENFNARQIDFGEEILYDNILEVIKNADTKIKNVSLEEPTIYTAIETIDGKDYYINDETSSDAAIAKKLYNKLALRNVLAGKIALFNYNEEFEPSVDEASYGNEYKSVYPDGEDLLEVTQVSSECKIGLYDKKLQTEVKLNDNEYIKFRAPSFKTVCTYPAYVNYYLHLDRGDNASAKPATFITFEKFLSDKSKLQEVSSEMFTSISSKNDLQYEVDGSTAERLDCPTVESDNSFEYNDIAYTISLVESIVRKNGTEETYPIENNKFTITEESVTFKINGTSGLLWLNFDGAKTVLFNDATSFILWKNWLIKQKIGSTSEKYKGFFYQYKQDTVNFVKGYLVDDSFIEYLELSAYKSSTLGALRFCYVQDASKLAENNYGLGINAVLNYIKANEEYKLKDNEYLFINYTESSSDSSESGEVKNIKYEKNTIIRPNFDLKDSAKRHTNEPKSYSKTEGFDTSWGIDGMFSLGTNEQIEIRDIISVDLFNKEDTSTSAKNFFVYWILDKDHTDTVKIGSQEYETIKFDSVSSDNIIILRDGEYFFYTDANKTDMAYYGSGTEVIINNSIVLRKNITENATPTLASIVENGVSSIPWVKVSLTKDKNITFNEYQYITLTKDDKLLSLEIKDKDDNLIDNTWRAVNSDTVTYVLSGSQGTLPSITNITKDSVNVCWEVRSGLEFNVGPKVVQTLHRTTAEETTSAGGTTAVTDIIYLHDLDNVKTAVPVKPSAVEKPVSIKTNYALQSSSDKIDTHITTISEDESTTVNIDDFKVKVFALHDLAVKETSPIALNNYGDGWTKISFSDFDDDNAGNPVHLDFNVNVTKDSEFGLLMFYYVTDELESNPNKMAFIKLKDADNKYDTIKPIIINNWDGSGYESWWTDTGYASTDYKYYLKPCKIDVGEKTKTTRLNIIKITSPCTIELYRGRKDSRQGQEDNTWKSEILVFSKLDIVSMSEDNKLGVNLNNIDYKQTSSDYTADRQLMNDIKAIDKYHEFYYNAPIEASTAININTNLTGEDTESLAMPKAWYDYNNINNKFVISEIDADYLSKGIIIESTSRLK